MFLKLLFFAYFYCFSFINGISSNCEVGRNNRRKLSEVIGSFNERVEKNFVGQYRAVREVRNEIDNRISLLDDDGSDYNVALVLHFVGPSGTGKSYLAEIVANSFFQPKSCKSFGARFQAGAGFLSAIYGAVQFGLLTNPFTAIAAAIGSGFVGSLGGLGMEKLMNLYCTDVDVWQATCGVVHATFSEASESYNSEALTKALYELAIELQYEKNSILILDDFNFCKKKCQKILKRLLTEHWLETPNGNKVSARNVLVLVTSDLTQFGGLELRRGEDYVESLERVESAAKVVWSADSLIMKFGRFIPFAPLTEGQLGKVLDMMLKSFDMEVRVYIVKALAKLKEARKDEEVEYTWSGRFICTEHTKTRILNGLHKILEKTNSRAIVDSFKTQLRQTLRTPKTLFTKIKALKPKFSRTVKDDKFGFSNPFNKNRETTFSFVEDIVLEVEPSNDFAVTLQFVTDLNYQRDNKNSRYLD